MCAADVAVDPSWSKSVHVLPSFAAHWPIAGNICRSLGQLWSTPAQILSIPCRISPKSFDMDICWTKSTLLQTRSILGQLWPDFGDFGPSLANIGQVWSELDQSRSSFSNIGQDLAISCLNRPNSAETYQTLADVGAEFGTLGQSWLGMASGGFGVDCKVHYTAQSMFKVRRLGYSVLHGSPNQEVVFRVCIVHYIVCEAARVLRGGRALRRTRVLVLRPPFWSRWCPGGCPGGFPGTDVPSLPPWPAGVPFCVPAVRQLWRPNAACPQSPCHPTGDRRS